MKNKHPQPRTKCYPEYTNAINTGQYAIRKVNGAECVAQDFRLTCLFDLSIRAQTLAM